MFLLSYKNTSESLGEREQETQASAFTAFFSSPKLSQVNMFSACTCISLRKYSDAKNNELVYVMYFFDHQK